MDTTTTSNPREPYTLLTLPAEIRIAILEHVFAPNLQIRGFRHIVVRQHPASAGIILDERYSANDLLRPLLTCRQIYNDGHLLAFNRTTFVIQSLFIANNITERLQTTLESKQIGAVRNITFIANARHFQKLIDWGTHPFSMPSLNLDTLTIVLHCSSHWHYLFDYTTPLATLLRTLHSVRRLIFVRNHALVKGSFKTWYNRLVGYIMKLDHHERYERFPARLESVWWEWSYDENEQSFCLEAKPPRDMCGEQEYLERLKPLMEELRRSVESEEWNPDPRSRNGF